MTGNEPLPTLWTPPAGACALTVEAGAHWDAVRVRGLEFSTTVLIFLERRTGSVILDSRTGTRYWLIKPRDADHWPAMADVTVLGRGVHVAVPPAWRTRRPGPHWCVPYDLERYLTDATDLHAALCLAREAAQRDGHSPPLSTTGLTALEREARDERLLRDLRQVNHRSRYRTP